MERSSRTYTVLSSTSEFGRSRLLIRCPWCSAEVTAYLWSLAGSGKRCACGVLLTWLDRQAHKDVTR